MEKRTDIPKGPQNKIEKWLDERFDISGLKDYAMKKSVPKFRETIWYYFGGITLLLFVVQVVSGILLLMYYKGTEDLAYESVRYINAKVEFGWLVRSVHSWSANLMVLAAFIHMFSVYFLKGFRKPRELTWYTGMLLFALALGFGFSGYLLPWNELAFFATKVGTDMVGQVPFAGKYFITLLRGGEEVTGATLSRFFGLHVAILPGLFTVFLTLHLIFIQRQGIAEPEEWSNLAPEKKKTIPFFPNFVLRELLIWLIVINLLAILAVYFPWELGKKADPFAPAPMGIQPEWYFLFAFQVLKYLPGRIAGINGELIGIVIFGIGGLLWLLTPFWDRRVNTKYKNRLLLYAGIFVVSFILVFTIIAYFSV